MNVIRGVIMKKKFEGLIISLLLFGVGICLLYWADKVIEIVSIILGSILVLYGIKKIYRYIKYDPKSNFSLVVAIISLIIGIVLLIKMNIIADTFSIIVGTFIISTCIGGLINSLEQKKSNYKINAGLSVTGIIIGTLCIIGKILVPNIILQFMGVLLIVYGVVNFINIIIVPNK